MDEHFSRILIVRTDRIGDILLTLPMAKVLKERIPGVHISMLIRRYTRELVEGDPNVDQILFYDDENGLLPFSHLAASLRTQKFDLVFHTYPRYRLALVTWFARIPVRVGTGYRWYSFLFNKKVYEHRKDARFHELEYNLRLLSSIGLEVDAANIRPAIDVRPPTADRIRELLREKGISDRDKVVVIHPGSGGSARDWSAKNFGELAARLSELNDVSIVVTGGKTEHAIVQEVIATA
ncbi:MAG TPA: glycosyltransferase family 9 protein, partial [Bacteroidota bacterium]|nr:glycosyltransferase family 9 protein [Bacteroidota bacterium]